MESVRPFVVYPLMLKVCVCSIVVTEKNSNYDNWRID